MTSLFSSDDICVIAMLPIIQYGRRVVALAVDICLDSIVGFFYFLLECTMRKCSENLNLGPRLVGRTVRTMYMLIYIDLYPMDFTPLGISYDTDNRFGMFVENYY